MDPPPAEGNFCDNSNRPVKPHIAVWYKRHTGYVENSDHMTNSYSMRRHTFKWTTKLFFNLDRTVRNSWIRLSSCGAKFTHRDFRILVRNLIEEAGKSQDDPTPWLVGRPTVAATNVVRLESRHNSNGQRNHPPNSTAVCVHLAAREGAQRISVPDVTWACLWCLVSQNIHHNKSVNHPHCEYCVVIKQWSKVLQTFCSNQNYVSNEQFTPHFI